MALLASMQDGAVTRSALEALARAVLGQAPPAVQLAASVALSASEGPALALAETTLASAEEPYRLAVEVSRGGPFAMRRAIELAALLVSADATPRASARED